MNIAKTLAVVVTLNLLVTASVMAQEKTTKSELRAIAVEACLTAAKNKYGAESVADSDEFAKVYRDTSRIRWNRGLKGMVVKMKIKPQSQRKAKYTCLVKADKSVRFFKA